MRRRLLVEQRAPVAISVWKSWVYAWTTASCVQEAESCPAGRTDASDNQEHYMVYERRSFMDRALIVLTGRREVSPDGWVYIPYLLKLKDLAIASRFYY